jgi:hypothetical protein
MRQGLSALALGTLQVSSGCVLSARTNSHAAVSLGADGVVVVEVPLYAAAAAIAAAAAAAAVLRGDVDPSIAAANAVMDGLSPTPLGTLIVELEFFRGDTGGTELMRRRR